MLVVVGITCFLHAFGSCRWRDIVVKTSTNPNYHRPLHHFNIEAETLVDGVRFPPNAGLELEHLRLVEDKTVLQNKHTIHQ